MNADSRMYYRFNKSIQGQESITKAATTYTILKTSKENMKINYSFKKFHHNKMSLLVILFFKISKVNWVNY